jgi:methylglutaconyl-CoA hydratase
MTKFILVSTSHGVTTITLNRPEKRNAMNGQLIHELLAALPVIAADKHARVLLINGSGNHFCAGADIAWLQEMVAGENSKNYQDAYTLADLMYQLYSFPKPTIALVHGTTMGGGLGIIATCDIAVAAKNASFSFSEVKIGLAPSTISPYVIAAIGERAAHYYFLTGDQFGADIAHRLGLIQQLTEPEALMSTGMTVAQIILQNSPQALTAVKQLIRHVTNEKITEDLSQKTAEHLVNLSATAEAQEGLQAFLEKRPPKWSDL